MNKTVTTSKSWKIHDMPAKKVHIPVNRIIPFEDMKLILEGYKPSGMEDKWFMYCDEFSIRIFRSWTGFCIYIGHFEPFKTDYIITTIAVNRDSSQYHGVSDEKEVELFFSLLDFFRQRKTQPTTPPSCTVSKLIIPEDLKQKYLSGEMSSAEYIKQIETLLLNKQLTIEAD